MFREELDQAQATILANGRTNNHSSNPLAPSQSPISRVHQNLPHLNQSSNGKLPPTGPRAYKKPRLSQTPSLPPSTHTNQHMKGNHPHGGTTRQHEYSDRSPRGSTSDRKVKMELDVEDRAHWSPARSRDYDRDKDKDKAVDRERDRDRDHGHGRDRDRPAAKERERDRHPHRERDRERERDRDRDRTRDFDRSSKRNGAYGGGNGGGGGRRPRRGSNANSYTSGGDRTLKERMGL